MFKEYIHIERYGTDEVHGIELGECYIFPKIDGTNGSIWWEDSNIQAGSRKRTLTLDSDNAGFYKYVLSGDKDFLSFFNTYPNLRLYGEWLVPHTIKKYREDSWRKFYIFDVYDDIKERFLPYNFYKEPLMKYGFDFIPPLCIIRNGNYDAMLREMKLNGFLMQDGTGHGEGIVIKNYDFINRFERYAYAKIVGQEFKDEHKVAMGPTIKQGKENVEIVICDKYLTGHMVEKTYAKIVNKNNGWNSRYIPQLLQTVYYDFVREELWQVIKKHKNPTINFETLRSVITNKIKTTMPELF